MATVQILGSGCPKCGQLAELATKAVRDAARDDVIEKVTDIVQILAFSPTALPALAINGKVVTAGTLPSSDQIRRFLELSTESEGSL